MKLAFFSCICLLISFGLSAQSVVVSGYINFNDPRDEWTELVVTGDNVDMRNWTIRDNNGSQTSWQTPVRFNNIPYWQNMRRGTVIMLWHRNTNSAGLPRLSDTDQSDGYIELDLQNTTYFNGGDFTSGGLGNTMNLNSTSDMVQLRNPSNVHIHVLGHGVTPGSNWTALPSPKLNHANTTNHADAVYVCPGATLADYDGPSGTTLTSRNNTTTTFGLPNSCIAWPGGPNRTFWRSLRQPDMTLQTITPSSVIPGTPGSITFSWAPASDPNPADNTIGYLILRNTTNSFPSVPYDGTTYSIGSVIGGATVVGHINNSLLSTFTDNTVMNGNSYYYRVYAFRYGTDNINGNMYDNARGRAYNETEFVFVDWPTPGSPLPVQWLSFTGRKASNYIELEWVTLSEKNNSHFEIEKSTDGKNFKPLTRVNGNGTTTSAHFYSANDFQPAPGSNYYRLRQVDFNGQFNFSGVIIVYWMQFNGLKCTLHPNPVLDESWLTVSSDDELPVTIRLSDMEGKVLMTFNGELKAGTNTWMLPFISYPAGVYVITVITPDHSERLKAVKHNQRL